MKLFYCLPIFILILFFSSPLLAQKPKNFYLRPEIIKKFAKCYSKSEISDAERQKVIEIIANPPCFIPSFYETLTDYLTISFLPNAYKNNLKECYYCQQIIIGAIEMHNQEHSQKLRSVNDKLISQPLTPLIPEYLQFPFKKVHEKCYYKSIGDITDGGLFIYCTYHGSQGKLENLK